MVPSRSTNAATTITRDLRARRSVLLKLAAKHGAKDVRVFGSVARGDARETSDVDLLVKMEAGRTLLDLAALRRSMAQALKRPVDVVSSSGLSPHLRKRILREAQPL